MLYETITHHWFGSHLMDKRDLVRCTWPHASFAHLGHPLLMDCLGMSPKDFIDSMKDGVWRITNEHKSNSLHFN